MAGRRFTLHSIRTSKQGQQINVGKDHDEYQAIVNTLTMNPDDMKALDIPAGGDGPAPDRRRRGRLPVPGGESARGDDLRPVRPADLPSDGRRNRRHGDAHLQGLGSGGRAGRVAGPASGQVGSESTGEQRWKPHNQRVEDGELEQGPHFADGSRAGAVRAWERSTPGRYMPRRIRGSFRGRELG